MKDEEEFIDQYEQWVLDNLSDDEDNKLDSIEKNKENGEIDEIEDDTEEVSALDRFRGDSSRSAKINLNEQTKVTIRLLMSILIIFLIILIVLKTQFNPVSVVGPSMYPTLNDGDILRTSTVIKKDRISYDTIICFKRGNSKLIIKRVVGLPGDTISFSDGRVVINGKVREDSFPIMEEYPDSVIKLGEDEYYCLGDNRNNSLDSRYFGAINISEITNIVVFNGNKSKESLLEAYDLYKLYKDGDFESSLSATPTDASANKATPTDALKNKATPTDAIQQKDDD